MPDAATPDAAMHYTKEHEWVRIDGDAAAVGISTHAQEQLGDVVFVELPQVGRVVAAAEEIAVVESVKAASEIYAPLAGEIVAVNNALSDNPGLVNEDAEGAGWFVRLKPADPGAVSGLMDQAAYDAYVAEQD